MSLFLKKKKLLLFSYLHSLPEVVPSPLPVQDVLVDLARRQVVLLLEGQVEEALVVAKVEVDLFCFYFDFDYFFFGSRSRV